MDTDTPVYFGDGRLCLVGLFIRALEWVGWLCECGVWAKGKPGVWVTRYHGTVGGGSVLTACVYNGSVSICGKITAFLSRSYLGG